MIKTKYLLLPFLLISLLFVQCKKSSTAAQVDTGISPASYISKLGKGMDVTWVETNTGISGYNVQMVKDIKSKGFSHARLRIHLDLNTDFNHLDKGN